MAESESAPAGPTVARQKARDCAQPTGFIQKLWKVLQYLNALDEVPHREVVVEEDADQHLHYFTVELKREVMRQD